MNKKGFNLSRWLLDIYSSFKRHKNILRKNKGQIRGQQTNRLPTLSVSCHPTQDSRYISKILWNLRMLSLEGYLSCRKWLLYDLESRVGNKSFLLIMVGICENSKHQEGMTPVLDALLWKWGVWDIHDKLSMTRGKLAVA